MLTSAYSLRGAQSDFSTPQKVREFLDDNDVTYTEEDSEGDLLKKARKRAKTLSRGTPQSAAKKLFAATKAHSVASLRRKVDSTPDIPEGNCVWTSVLCVIDDLFDLPLVKLKHGVGTTATCRGLIKDGTCRGCNSVVPGVYGYAFNIMVMDKDDRHTKYVLTGSEGAGTALFGMSGAAFAQLSRDEQQARIEAITEERVVFGVQIRGKSDEHLVLAYGPTMVGDEEQ